MSNKINRDLEYLHPDVRDRALQIWSKCMSAGLDVDIFETWRSAERQKWLKSNGKSKTLNSYHRLGLAVDFVFKTKSDNWTWRVKKEKWDQLADIIEECGMISLWKRSGWDGPHAELRIKGTNSRTLNSKLAKYVDREGIEDLEHFWEKEIDPLLPEGSITFTSTQVEAEEAHDIENVPAKPNLLTTIINFFLRLFGKNAQETK